MGAVRGKAGALTVVAYRGDAKTLLAFDLTKAAAKGLAGFTIECRPQQGRPYYLQNSLRYEHPERHAQDAAEPATSSLNAPFHKFHWMHVPGSLHQGLQPFYGPYTYVVTPRYVDAQQSLQPLDRSLSVEVEVEVGPLRAGSLEVGFTRGFTQSQAFVNRFGREARIQPKDRELRFDTSQHAGTNASGEQFTYAQAYEWLGFSARRLVFDLLGEVEANKKLRLDVFAYDLNEPDVIGALLTLAEQGRVRVILDNAGLHHSNPNPKPKPGSKPKPKPEPKPEDEFEQLFAAAAKGGAAIKRGKFKRYAHDKVLVVSDARGPVKVLTGSTNFSLTGMYVNSNHVLLFDDRELASKYAEVFESVWDGDVQAKAWLATRNASEAFRPAKASPPVEVTFAPHSKQFAQEILGGLVSRIEAESKDRKASHDVMFAVMAIDHGTSPVYEVLNALHADDRVFSLGISDDPAGIALYEPKRKTGVLVTGKPAATKLPPPFSQVRGVGAGHQIHHKFVICGFNGPQPVVYCGSSNLAMGGEESNGDNLLAIRDPDVVTAFTIEALALVDHFQFLNRVSKSAKQAPKLVGVSRQHAAEAAGWFLSTSDRWAQPYFDPSDLHCVERGLFA